jgi:hypothetical protein
VFLRTTENDRTWQLGLAVSTLLTVALFGWSVVCARIFHPAKLVARPEVPAFDVPPNPGVVLGTTGFTFVVVMMLSGLVRDIATGTDLWFSVTFAVPFAGMLAVWWWSALGRFGARLIPAGIIDRQMFGSLFIPWDALATPCSAYAHNAHQVTLYLAHPELVRRRGLRFGGPGLLPAAGINAELLARAIHEYANRAGTRSDIGSKAELDRFHAIPQIIDLAHRAGT